MQPKQRASEAADRTWWVRLGATHHGPLPWSLVRARREAGLFSRWHEVSRDGRAWLPIDEVAPTEDQPVELPEDAGALAAAGETFDWQRLASGPPGPPGSPGRTGAAGEGAASKLSMFEIAVWSTACLWAVLWFVPLAWWNGAAIWAWSGPVAWRGWGIVFAAWWWGVGGVVMGGWMAWRGLRASDRGGAWCCGLAAWLAVGWLGLLLGGPWASRVASVLVLVPLSAVVWLVRGWRGSSSWSTGGVGAVAVTGVVYFALAWWLGAEDRPTARAGASVTEGLVTAWSSAGRTHGVMSAVYLWTHVGLLTWLYVSGIGRSTQKGRRVHDAGANPS